MPLKSDVVVIGAGVIGCATAYRLAQEGLKVLVVDQSNPGTGATRASAGMLTPLAEASEPGPFQKMALESLKIYPDFIQSVVADSQVEPDFQRTGVLRVALTPQEAEKLSALARLNLGLPTFWLSPEEARELEPNLSPAILGALWSPEEAQLESSRWLVALIYAGQRRGVQYLYGQPVKAFLTQGGRVLGVALSQEEIQAGVTILAAGAWSGILARALEITLPVFPVRGQVFSVIQPPQPMQKVVFGNLEDFIGYLVPKPNGRIIIGGTMEPVGFNPFVTLEGLEKLATVARTLAPGLKDALFESAWAGLRPGTPDHHPILGPVEGWEGFLLATGHFRSGILLAPITAEWICRLVREGSTFEEIHPFLLKRFQVH